ncbi:acyl dehydratase [Halogeometricum borinquense DSM 11551]|uniref:Acyl dehydratase n=1 Tax=Halogeometricum borinquense (strain ATCC 700274 / DSM 11551 / JCM 10706 / KCTC 4070 / PR3) TaxID=469382 RepID=E4NVP9_HALBP|nr:CBS domain-containing protein [Halogeometricum borinquense]ADQ68933.1 acyl dehydratase [Halogeometricum borinquense DSM 11551]ELY28937.1 acyl dehydratase [Halogeometricum borinquense DSM 11551]
MLVSIPVSEVMTDSVETTTPETTAREAAVKLFEKEVGSLVVCRNGSPVGIITEYDLTKLLAAGTDLDTTSVSEFMSDPLITIEHDADISEAAKMLRAKQIEHLPVTDGDELVGVLAAVDLSYYLPQISRPEPSAKPEQEAKYVVHPETAFEEPEWEFECRCITRGHIVVGDVAEFSKTISEEDVERFAASSGDTNRLHLSDEYAKQTRFGKRIAHGTLVAGLISAALARLPGLTIYLSQELTFHAPVEIGSRVTAVCEVIEDLGRDRYRLTTDVYTDGETHAIEGEAVVLIDDLPDTVDVEVEEVAD